jgi:S-adenosyl-L-methionine hydrolase (adenosine-forming)
MLTERPLITLLTDFGTTDYFVAALKGVILSINAHVHIVDITHEIPSHDIEAGAFTLLASHRAFPRNTIHVAVVDPGVGSARRPVLVVAGQQFFIGPDNGIFSYIFEAESEYQIFELKKEQYFRHPVSATFHGRDIFAPVAAFLSNGVRPADFGKEINDEVRLSPLKARPLKNGNLEGRIIHVDRFGNCITNITRDLLIKRDESRARLRVNGTTIRSFREFFSDEARPTRKLFGLWGSAGFLEIAVNSHSAAEMLGVRRGEPVILEIK